MNSFFLALWGPPLFQIFFKKIPIFILPGESPKVFTDSKVWQNIRTLDTFCQTTIKRYTSWQQFSFIPRVKTYNTLDFFFKKLDINQVLKLSGLNNWNTRKKKKSSGFDFVFLFLNFWRVNFYHVALFHYDPY